MERLKHMKECLVNCAQNQMGHLENVDTKELGEVIDMIKDLEEAIYYSTVTKAMKEPSHKQYYTPPKYPYEMKEEYEEAGWFMPEEDEMYNPKTQYDKNMIWEMERDEREGSSPIYRKKYMESKEMHHDKMKQMESLEDYMQELSKDITDMIKDASSEERQMLHQKLNTLISKIKQ